MKFAYSLETVICLTLPLLASAAPHQKKTTATTTKTTASTSTTTTPAKTTAPPVTVPSSVASNYCGVTGISDGLTPYKTFAYNSNGIINDRPSCKNACLADNKCQSFLISENTYVSPAQATCELFDVPIDAYISDRGYNSGAKPPSIINYFYDRSICFPKHKATPTKTTTPTATPPAVTVAPSIANQYCDFPGDLPSQHPYNIYSFQYSGSGPADAASKNCELNCLSDKKCLTYMVTPVGGGYGQCFFYNAGFDQLNIQADESSAYFWDRNHCFPKYASSG